jgi:hypothetical protein
MPQPTLSDVHVDTALTDFSVAYFQDQSRFAAAQNIFPTVNVPQRSGKYYVYDKAELNRSDTEKRAPNTEAAVRTYKLSNDSYHCEVYSVAVDVSEQIRANADPALDPEEDAARVAIQDMRIAMDRKWTQEFFSTGIWATESTATWSSSTGARSSVEDLVFGVKTVLTAYGKRPNTLVLGADSWYSGLWTSTDLIDRLPDNAPRIVTPEFVAGLFGFERVFVLDSVQSTGMEGSSGLAPTFIHEDHALLAYVDPAAGLREATAGKTFMWSGLVGGTEGIRTKRLEMPWKDAMPRVEVDSAFDYKVVASDLGILFKNTVS